MYPNRWRYRFQDGRLPMNRIDLSITTRFDDAKEACRTVSFCHKTGRLIMRPGLSYIFSIQVLGLP
jgi:hypothetical protein